MGKLEGLISKLPGVKGYREKELRRDSDKQVRDTLARELSDRRTKITALQQELLSAGGLLWMDDLEKVVGRLQLLIDRVKTAAYGYAGFFDAQRIKEGELDKLAAFDEAIFEDLPRIDTAIAIAGPGHRRQRRASRRASLHSATSWHAMNETFGKRMEAVRGGQ